MIKIFLPLLLLIQQRSLAQDKHIKILNVGEGWAANSINTVIFRKNSLASFSNTQFIAYYDADGFVMLGKRTIGSENWELKRTVYKGGIKDAHNSISIMLDGEGYLHMAWDHHNHPLHYVKSTAPLSLGLTEMMPMTGTNENKISYPEFYRTKDGGLLFLYRDGSSGNGNLVINKYDLQERKWKRVQSNLIDGEGKRNAYWQAFVDVNDAVHVSWIWRESPDVASNHDMCYAISRDGGMTWEKSTGEKYNIPINLASAERIVSIPQNSELINQTSMCADETGNPYIASYWRGINNVPQYKLVYKKAGEWLVKDLGFRKTNFSLSGGGTKQIPVSRPQLLFMRNDKQAKLAMLFRDAERGNKVSVAVVALFSNKKPRVYDLTNETAGSWEPSYDTELWKQKKRLNVFLQHVEQADGEKLTDAPPQMVRVLEYRF